MPDESSASEKVAADRPADQEFIWSAAAVVALRAAEGVTSFNMKHIANIDRTEQRSLAGRPWDLSALTGHYSSDR